MTNLISLRSKTVWMLLNVKSPLTFVVLSSQLSSPPWQLKGLLYPCKSLHSYITFSNLLTSLQTSQSPPLFSTVSIMFIVSLWITDLITCFILVQSAEAVNLKTNTKGCNYPLQVMTNVSSKVCWSVYKITITNLCAKLCSSITAHKSWYCNILIKFCCLVILNCCVASFRYLCSLKRTLALTHLFMLSQVQHYL